MRQRIGVFGGTFDPVHNGHLNVAEAILDAFELNRMLFVPAFIPPHKRKQAISSPFHRFAMLSLATEDRPEMFVSTIEIESPSRPYTIETLGQLKNELHPVRLFFVMGADSFKDITSWREHERILTEYDVIVATRPGYRNDEDIAGHLAPHLRERIADLRGGRMPVDEDSGSPRICLTDYVSMDVSATGVREAVEKDLPVDHLVPTTVASYIAKYRLYRNS